jgi:DNA-directed RNA polymerase subunit RPC12/RpoP/predicted Zn-ribbon and HTH transcriptional regulator
MGKNERARERPKHEVAEVIRKFERAYLEKYRYTYAQRCVVNNILKCRTAALGGHIRACKECGKTEVAYNPCKDRQCPKCGAYDKAQWLEEQKIWTLPTYYYHLIFTIDHVFNPLVWKNQKAIYNLLMRTSARTIQIFGKKYFGGEMGITMALHTWGQTMQRHAHTHAMVTGGALVEESGQYRWNAAKKSWLFPAQEFSAAFRQAFCDGIRKLWKKGKLKLEKERKLDVEQMLMAGESQKWEVYIQTPRGQPEDLLDYLGRYVYRTAMSNYRILAVGEKKVRFEYYDNREDGKLKKMDLEGVEFIRRYLDHVLPKGFQRVRHYGLHHSSSRKKIEIARLLLGGERGKPAIKRLKLEQWLGEILEEEQPFRCPYCGKGVMEKVREFSGIETWRLKFAPIVGKLYQWGWGY